MATQHALTCPQCHSQLLIEHRDTIGGQVISNLVLVKETPDGFVPISSEPTLRAK